MTPPLIDADELRRRMTLAMHIIASHHASQGETFEPAKALLLQAAIERRVTLALEKTDVSEMRYGWCWKEAAEKMALHIALAIVKEQRRHARPARRHADCRQAA